MRTIIKILTLILLLAINISCKKETPLVSNCGEEYYYYQDQKIYLYVNRQKITVGFYDTLSFQEIKNIIDNYSFIEPITENQVNVNKRRAIANLRDTLTCNQIYQGLKEMIKNPKISYSNSFLMTQTDNHLVGVLGEFIVCLRDTNQTTELDSLASATNTAIIKQDKYNPCVYILFADKNSKGNALLMANYFYETGKFEWSVPNFLKTATLW